MISPTNESELSDMSTTATGWLGSSLLSFSSTLQDAQVQLLAGGHHLLRVAVKVSVVAMTEVEV